MREKKTFFICLLITLIVAAVLMTPGVESSHVYAQAPSSLAEHGSCTNCHENLYFLHDTGKWFCLRESPMQCVDCHGGDPNAMTQEAAHLNRKAHPILNEDVSKCQECHPKECEERVAKFDKVAGISEVLVAVPYRPTSVIASDQPLVAPVTEPDEYPDWISAMELITLVLITGLALVIYIIHHTRRS